MGHFIALKSEFSRFSFLKLTADVLLLFALISTTLRKFQIKIPKEISSEEKNYSEGLKGYFSLEHFRKECP